MTVPVEIDSAGKVNDAPLAALMLWTPDPGGTPLPERTRSGTLPAPDASETAAAGRGDYVAAELHAAAARHVLHRDGAGQVQPAQRVGRAIAAKIERGIGHGYDVAVGQVDGPHGRVEGNQLEAVHIRFVLVHIGGRNDDLAAGIGSQPGEFGVSAGRRNRDGCRVRIGDNLGRTAVDRDRCLTGRIVREADRVQVVQHARGQAAKRERHGIGGGSVAGVIVQQSCIGIARGELRGYTRRRISYGRSSSGRVQQRLVGHIQARHVAISSGDVPCDAGIGTWTHSAVGSSGRVDIDGRTGAPALA